MKKIVQYIISALMVLTLLITTDVQVSAADIGLKASASSVKIGDNVTFTVTIPEGVTGTVHLSFSEDMLTYVSASAEVGVTSGKVKLHVGKLSAAGSNKMTVTFKAKTAGDATVKASVIEAYDNNSLDPVTLGGASTKITIKNEAAQSQLSTDYFLAKLNVTANGNKVALSPNFVYSKTVYTATVEHDVTEVVVSASLSSAKAEIVSMTGNGKVALNVGENVIEVVVKAENGKTLTYKVTVTRKEKPTDIPVEPPTPPTPATPDFEQGGTPLYVVETPDNKIPTGFVEKTIILAGGKEVLGLSFEKAELTVLYLENDSKAGGLYVYNAADNYIYPFVKLSAEESYVIVLMPEDAQAPEGYVACTLSIEGKGVVNAYQLQGTRTVDLADFYLVYCVNHNGVKGWYQYDSLEGTFQRYIGTVSVPNGPSDTEDESESASQTESDSQLEEPGTPTAPSTPSSGTDKPADKPFDWKTYEIIIICAVVFLVAVIIILIISIVRTKKQDGFEDEEDEDFDEEVFKRKAPVEEELPKIDVESVMKEELPQHDEDEEVEFLDL